MNVTLFGATGKTGRYLIEEGLKRGITLTVFARSSSPFERQDVRVIRGDLTDRSALHTAIQGADAVLSALGPTSFAHPADLPITRATEAIVSVMQEDHVCRLIAISTGTAIDPGDRFDMKIRLPAFLIRVAMPSSYSDIIGLAETIRSSSLDWTMARAGFLTNGPHTHSLNVGLYGRTRHSLAISRADMAAFMFDQVDTGEYSRKAPGVSAA